MSDPKTSHKIVVGAGIICLMLAFLPWSSKRSPATSSFVAGSVGAKISQTVLTLGIPTSPWFERVKETLENPDGTVVYSDGRTYNAISLSSLLGIAGAVLFVLSRRMKPREQPPAK
jgi:hypothetical protein